tara:strand:- start:498 stop:785 length:288 start_codon:yes stop_codon:yes gene_type:complete
MFGLMIKECGLSKMYRPILTQVRNYKRDINIEEREKYIKTDKKLDTYGKQLYYPKYGSSLYDDKMNENLKPIQPESKIKYDSLHRNILKSLSSKK